MLVFDTETTIDAAQQLNFGSWRFYDTDDPADWSCLGEGLFHADDLPVRDPDGYAILRQYVRDHTGDVDSNRIDVRRRLELLSATAFAEQVFYRATVKAHATVVAFNLPFDVSRLALTHGVARDVAGTFTFSLFQHDGRHNRYRPAITIRHLNRHASITKFGGQLVPDEVDRGPLTTDLDKKGNPKRIWFPGHFLDTHTLAFALTNTHYSLQRAAQDMLTRERKGRVERHGVITADYIDYNRQDVTVTAELTRVLVAEYERHPIALPVTQAYSPASIAKGYLRAMGLKPVLDRQLDFDPVVLGQAMSTFYGGRAECMIRRTIVPVALVDFTSMYPTVDVLMDLWALLTAERVDVVDATVSVQTLLDTVSVDDCFDPALWPQLIGIAQIQPDEDVLPVRGAFGDNPNLTIGVHPVSSDEPLWYTIADLIAAKLLGGKTPQVMSAIRFVPSDAQQDGLTHVKIRSQIQVDPTLQDFFATAVEQRQRIKQQVRTHAGDCRCEQCRLAGFLKVLANAGSYGIYAEMNPNEQTAGKTVEVAVYGRRGNPRSYKLRAPEKPGDFCFPPIATVITGAARLMLTILETCVTQFGGRWVFCDTDSMAIVADEHGTLVACPGGEYELADGTAAIRALSHEQVQTIIDRFETLNPYDKNAVPGSILHHDSDTDRGNCFAISAKRYTFLHNDPGPDSTQLVDDYDETFDDEPIS